MTAPALISSGTLDGGFAGDGLLASPIGNADDQALAQRLQHGMTYLADTDADNPLASLQAASCIYRIASGPRAGQKVLSLRTTAGRDEKIAHGLCADTHGLSLHAGVRCGADQHKQLERLCRSVTRPALANEWLERGWRRSRRAATEERLARRHDTHQDVGAGIYAAPGSAGAAPAPAPDPLSRGVGTERRAACRDRARCTAEHRHTRGRTRAWVGRACSSACLLSTSNTARGAGASSRSSPPSFSAL